jgi:hypothetical protein
MGHQGSPADLNADMGCAGEPAGEEYLGYTTGDWLRYTVTVQQAGTYVISGHQGIAGNGVKVSFTFSPTLPLAACAWRPASVVHVRNRSTQLLPQGVAGGRRAKQFPLAQDLLSRYLLR